MLNGEMARSTELPNCKQGGGGGTTVAASRLNYSLAIKHHQSPATKRYDFIHLKESDHMPTWHLATHSLNLDAAVFHEVIYLRNVRKPGPLEHLGHEHTIRPRYDRCSVFEENRESTHIVCSVLIYCRQVNCGCGCNLLWDRMDTKAGL